jgi:23S rRNA (cytidine2498-2'-O)-methyltransferase
MLLTCQPGFEPLLARELAAVSLAPAGSGSGWVLAGAPAVGRELPDLAFPHAILVDPVEITGDSVNALARGVSDFLLRSLAGEKVEGPWPCVWLEAREPVGLGRRAQAVEDAFREILRSRLSRVARLALPAMPRTIGRVRGLFVRFTDFGRAWVSREAVANGQCRMADDPQAPSRSYLKVEEAYGILGAEPRPGETVADLGAAPGGWTYSAARRGARVVAVDNGPLKGGALDHPQVEHRCEDAFLFRPAGDAVFDWLFCDMLEEPHHVLHRIAGPWLSGRWCRRFVINLKFGRVDPTALAGELRASGSALAAAAGVRIRHLYHDREEFTVVGTVPGC